MKITAYDLAQRFVGVKEIPGKKKNDPQIMSMLSLDVDWPTKDEVPWCSAFINYVAWLLRLPRSISLIARSWLGVGKPIELVDARAGFDIVILKRGRGAQPGPEDRTAPGHVGFYAGKDGDNIIILGGNQSNSVCLAHYPKSRLLGTRRLWSNNLD